MRSSRFKRFGEWLQLCLDDKLRGKTPKTQAHPVDAATGF